MKSSFIAFEVARTLSPSSTHVFITREVETFLMRELISAEGGEITLRSALSLFTNKTGRARAGLDLSRAEAHNLAMVVKMCVNLIS
jgi:hypothetical protein